MSSIWYVFPACIPPCSLPTPRYREQCWHTQLFLPTPSFIPFTPSFSNANEKELLCCTWVFLSSPSDIKTNPVEMKENRRLGCSMRDRRCSTDWVLRALGRAVWLLRLFPRPWLYCGDESHTQLLYDWMKWCMCSTSSASLSCLPWPRPLWYGWGDFRQLGYHKLLNSPALSLSLSLPLSLYLSFLMAVLPHIFCLSPLSQLLTQFAKGTYKSTICLPSQLKSKMAMC